MRPSHYYLEDGFEHGLLLLLCEFHFALIVILLLLPVTSLDHQKLENHLHKKSRKSSEYERSDVASFLWKTPGFLWPLKGLFLKEGELFLYLDSFFLLIL
jgi:hypothetical protein